MHIHVSDGWHAGIAAAQWLALRLQTIAAFVISLVALLAVLGHEALLPFAVRDDKFAASKSSLLNIYCVVVLHANLPCCMILCKLAASVCAPQIICFVRAVLL